MHLTNNVSFLTRFFCPRTSPLPSECRVVWDGISAHVVVCEEPDSPFAPPPGLFLVRAPPTLRTRAAASPLSPIDSRPVWLRHILAGEARGEGLEWRVVQCVVPLPTKKGIRVSAGLLPRLCFPLTLVTSLAHLRLVGSNFKARTSRDFVFGTPGQVSTPGKLLGGPVWAKLSAVFLLSL